MTVRAQMPKPRETVCSQGGGYVRNANKQAVLRPVAMDLPPLNRAEPQRPRSQDW